MLRKLLTLAAIIPFAASAQTVATFEGLTLPTTDTYYVNYTMPGQDVGFINGLAHFPLMYDTTFHFPNWDSGFIYTNKRDSVHSGFSNQYSAKAGIGYDSSANYVVAYGLHNRIQLLGGAKGHSVQGFYVTNSTYAYNDMRDGSTYSKKFGGPTGNDRDFFRLIVQGYFGGVLKPDSVIFDLADFTFNNNSNDYIVKDWRWVNLMPLGSVDSLEFTLSSSDTGAFGINTPLYFCMDNFITNESALGVQNHSSFSARIYPIPAGNLLNIDNPAADIEQVVVMDAAGKQVYAAKPLATHIEIPLQTLPSGVYFLQLRATEGRTSNTRFVKQ